MKKPLIFLLVVISLLGVSSFAAAADPCSGSTLCLPNPLCLGGAGSPGCINDFQTLVTKVTDFALTIIGSIAVLVFIWAGILFLTSGVKPENVSKARQALWWAVIGIAIALVGKGLIAVITALLNPPA